jgi:hypothetical protein
MRLIPKASRQPARLLGLVAPLAVALGLVILLLLPNLIMHTDLRSNGSPAVSMLGNGMASQSAATADSPALVR